jgi:selenocysteine lyase/cysteine desulfurase
MSDPITSAPPLLPPPATKPPDGYRGFGSFFVEEDVEVLVRKADDQYDPPALPFADGKDPLDAYFARCGDGDGDSDAHLALGLAARQHFCIDFPSWRAFVNHGAFGAVSRPAAEVANAWRAECERQPLRFFDRTLLPHIADAGRRAARFVAASPGDVALVPNATTGLQAAINACAPLLHLGVAAVCLSVGYGAVKLALREACETQRQGSGGGGGGGGTSSEDPPRYLELRVRFPRDVRSPQAFVRGVRRELRRALAGGANEEKEEEESDALFAESDDDDDEGEGEGEGEGDDKQPLLANTTKIAMAVVDAVTSNTALRLPLPELCAMLRAEGAARVIVDGAHALGQLPGFGGGGGGGGNTNDSSTPSPAPPLPTWNCDYAALNVHKWLCGARGGAMLWARPEHQQEVRPPITSHGARSGFFSAFAWDGARDYAPVLAVPAALRFWQQMLGGDASIARNEALLWDEAVPMLLRAWWGGEEKGAGAGGWTLVPRGSPLAAPCMALVALPAALQRPRPAQENTTTPTHNRHRHRPPSPAALARARQFRGAATSADAKRVQDLLFERRVECPVKCVQGVLYVRASCCAYNVLADYEALAEAVLEVVVAAAGEGG